MPKQQDIRKKIHLQNIIIIILAVVICIMLVVSTTAAWYIRTRTDSAEIVLAQPVNIVITDNGETTEDILEDYRGRIYPGDEIGLKLGFKLGTENESSSPAYVRVKLQIVFEDKNGKLLKLEDVKESDAAIVYKDKPDPTVWQLVDFNKYKKLENDKIESDFWYVLKNEDGSAKIVQDKEMISFLDGNIKLDKEKNTNEQANCKFHFKYVVQAMQTVNVEDPLIQENKGPWWEGWSEDNHLNKDENKENVK